MRMKPILEKQKAHPNIPEKTSYKLPIKKSAESAKEIEFPIKTATADMIKPKKRDGGNIVFLHVAKSAGTALSDFLTKNVALKTKGTPDAHLFGYILVNKMIHSKE